MSDSPIARFGRLDDTIFAQELIEGVLYTLNSAAAGHVVLTDDRAKFYGLVLKAAADYLSLRLQQ